MTLRLDRYESILLNSSQSRLLGYLAQLDPQHQEELLKQIESLDVKTLCKVQSLPYWVEMFHTAMEALTRRTEPNRRYQPPKCITQEMFDYNLYNSSSPTASALPRCYVMKEADLPNNTYKALQKKGEELIYQGKIATVILAGGQGTRLGWPHPKGTFPLGPVSSNSIFQIICEKFKTQLKRVEEKMKNSGLTPAPSFLYIMTSNVTNTATVDFFESHSFFGIPKKSIQFFIQDDLPVFDLHGNILLENEDMICRAPNGNGGLFLALEKSGILSKAREENILGFHVFSVDNPKIKVLNPIFLAFSHISKADVGTLCIKKIDNHEKLGVLCTTLDFDKQEEVPMVAEYTELANMICSDSENEESLSKFTVGNICNHFFTLDFLERILQYPCREKLFQCHAAIKKISHLDYETGQRLIPKENNCAKLEFFIFDCFSLANKVAALEVNREENFAPLKNATGEDSIQVCRQLYSNLHKTWALNAGVILYNDKEYLEISPTLSIEGENLAKLKGVHLSLPHYLC